MNQRGLIAVGWLYLIGVIAILAMLGTAAYKIRESGKDAIRLEWAKANEEQRALEAKRANDAAKALEKANAKRKIVYRTITQTVDKVVERPVYRNICLDDSGLRCLDSAIRGEVGTECKPDDPVPATGKPDGKGR